MKNIRHYQSRLHADKPMIVLDESGMAMPQEVQLRGPPSFANLLNSGDQQYGSQALQQQSPSFNKSSQIQQNPSQA